MAHVGGGGGGGVKTLKFCKKNLKNKKKKAFNLDLKK
jgi:hypothetical protein